MMAENNKQSFGEIWVAAAENYRVTVTPLALRMAFEALKPVLTIEQVRAAVMAYMADPDETFPPKTNDIVARAKGTAKEREGAIAARAELAWVSLTHGRGNMTDTVGIAVMRGMFGVDSWAMKHSTIKELDFKRREFIANYLAYHHEDAAKVLANIEHAKPALAAIAKEREASPLAIVLKATAMALTDERGCDGP